MIAIRRLVIQSCRCKNRGCILVIWNSILLHRDCILLIYSVCRYLRYIADVWLSREGPRIQRTRLGESKISLRELGGAYNINKTPNNQQPADSYQTPRPSYKYQTASTTRLQAANCKTPELHRLQTAKLTTPSLNSRMPQGGRRIFRKALACPDSWRCVAGSTRRDSRGEESEEVG